MQQKPAPVVLFVYNRPQHTEQCLAELAKNTLAIETELYIFSDGPKQESDLEKIKAVRALIKNISGFKDVKITERETNLGLANSVIRGVTEVINIHNRVIVLEDDLITCSNFLNYMNNALDYYEDHPKAGSVTGFSLPPSLYPLPSDYPFEVYFSHKACSTGWGTWKHIWDTVDWEVSDYDSFMKDKKRKKQFNSTGNNAVLMLKHYRKGIIDSWAIRWHYHHFKNDFYCVFPVSNLLYNTGFDGTGIHSKEVNDSFYNIKYDPDRVNFEFTAHIEENLEVNHNFQRAFNLPVSVMFWIHFKKYIFYDYIKQKNKRNAEVKL
jgi:hypothetical protein